MLLICLRGVVGSGPGGGSCAAGQVGTDGPGGVDRATDGSVSCREGCGSGVSGSCAAG